MAEIKTQPVTAVAVAKEDFRRDGIGAVPGSFYVTSPMDDGLQTFWYCCPCGCGAAGVLNVGNGFKPQTSRPSWNWNGSLDRPTLTPSVWHKGHWHGFLTDGVWRSC